MSKFYDLFKEFSEIKGRLITGQAFSCSIWKMHEDYFVAANFLAEFEKIKVEELKSDPRNDVIIRLDSIAYITEITKTKY